MKTTDSIVGKWSRIENIRNIRIEEVYAFYSNGAGQLWITDNCDRFEEHALCYNINSGILYLIEDENDNIQSRPITIEDNILTINDKGIVKQYIRED